MVALVAIAAFAVQATRRAPSEQSYTITFKDTGTKDDASTKRTTIADIIASGEDFVSEITTATNVYNARSGRGLKLGTSKASGTLVMTLAEAVKPTKIVFKAMKYGTSENEKSITVNTLAVTELTGEIAEYTVNYDGETEISTISISTPEKRAYITEVKVYYMGEAPAVVKPTISGTTPFVGSTEVTLACATEGAAIRYTLDGNDPTAESTLYEAPFTLTETATVKAIAIMGSDVSDVVSKEFVAIPIVANIAALNKLADKADFSFSGEALVTYKNGKYCFIKDATGVSLLYGSTPEAIAKGKTIAANWTGRVSIYNSWFEAVPNTGIAAKDGDAVEVAYDAVETVAAADMNKIVVLKGVKAFTAFKKDKGEGDTDARQFTITKKDDEALVGFNRFLEDTEASEEGATYNITGAVSVNGETVQFLPIEIAKAVFYNVTVADGITGGTVEVSAAKAEAGDEVTITATPAEGYKLLSISVKNGEEDVAVSGGKFTMPAGNVTVSATFVQPEDITIAPTEGDIYAALKAATTDAGKIAKNITINLAANGAYTVSGSIEAPVGLTIAATLAEGENAPAIDASALTDAFVVLNGSTTFEKKSDGTESAYYRFEDVKLNNVNITGLKQSLARSGQKSMIKSFVVDNCIINMEANKNVFDFNTNPAYAETWTVQNSTLWSKAGNGSYFIQNNAKCPDIDSDHKCVITLNNNTFYQIAKGKQFNNGNQFKGKSYVEINLNKNIFVYSGNAGGNSVKGLCFGQASENMIKTFADNTFWADADESANWGKMGAVALTTDPAFKDAANGDFAIASNSAQAKAEGGQTGDARWGTYDAGFAVKVVNAEGITITPEVAYAAEGEKVYATYTLAEGYELEIPSFVDDNGDEIAFAEGQIGLEEVGGVEKMFIIMPAKNVTIIAKASKKYQIALNLSQENGNATCLSVNKEKPETAFKKEGDKIYLAINPDAGYEAVISVKAGEDDVEVTAEAGTYDEQKYTHFFTMPASAVTVTVTFKSATGINSIAADKMKNATIYNMKGQRVDKAQKGLYIINGKKVVIK